MQMLMILQLVQVLDILGRCLGLYT